jgi:hypothetical protein
MGYLHAERGLCLGAGKTQSQPAIWQPDPYQNWTRFATSKQTTPAPHRRCGVIYQDIPRFIGQAVLLFLLSKTLEILPKEAT